MQYLPASPGMLDIGGFSVRRVETYKILGVHLSSDLTGNMHIEYIMKKASKCLYALSSLKKALRIPWLKLRKFDGHVVTTCFHMR